jgi:hypothetical protein
MKNFAVIPWSAGNGIYDAKNVVKWYALEKPAQKYADKLNALDANNNLVVRPKAYIREQVTAADYMERGIIEVVKASALHTYKDTGTCVLGMKLRYKGRLIADQHWQGCTPNYQMFQDIKSALIDQLGYEEKDFYMDEGVMD